METAKLAEYAGSFEKRKAELSSLCNRTQSMCVWEHGQEILLFQG